MTNLSLINWYAWSPGFQNREDWKKSHSTEEYLTSLNGLESPEVKWIPSRKRRRCSNLTRIALHTGFNCCKDADVDPGEVKSVFASRHGEIRFTTNLLKTLADDELLSPMSFGNSVHNTPSSYFCMCADNHHPSRTVSACEETFQNGMLDAVSMLDLSPDLPVLVVFANITPPAPFNRYATLQNASWGIAFLLSESSNDPDLTFELENKEANDELNLPPSIAFLDWYLNEDAERLRLPRSDQSVSWMFTRS